MTNIVFMSVPPKHRLVARRAGTGNRRRQAFLALIGIGLDGEHALEMISAVKLSLPPRHRAALHDDAAMITGGLSQAGRPSPTVTPTDVRKNLENALDITLCRSAEFINLQGVPLASA